MITRPALPRQRVLVFGSQALSLDASALYSLYTTLQSAPEYAWAIKTIQELPKIWSTFVEQFPQYNIASSAQSIDQVVEWSKTGTLNQTTTQLPNVILGPLVVTLHVSEYLELSRVWAFHEQLPKSNYSEALGFCTGLLSALAVSLSEDAQQLEVNGAVAIRLSMVIGGIVDAREHMDYNGTSKSLATAWSSSEGGEAFEKILAGFPDVSHAQKLLLTEDLTQVQAYTSVIFDKRRATVIAPTKTANQIQQEMRGAGLIASEVSLRGRFHLTQPSRKDNLDDVINFCTSQSALCLPDASALVTPVRSNQDNGKSPFITGVLHKHVLGSILSQQCDWYGTFSKLASSLSDATATEIVTFGPERCVPQSLVKDLESAGARLVSATESARSQRTDAFESRQIRRDDIAVIGMSIKVAGADDVSEFYDLLNNGQSQHKEVPEDRIVFKTALRETDTNRKWFGNFINDPDAFDHKFFKKSAREAAAMDPQQRLAIMTAYQALEQAGYLSTAEDKREKKVGCYVGVCSADYENNVACHQPNAFTATGNLKSFIAGKISHYFGWTSSAMCIDTACSSSLVAIHLACKAILSGECHAALAGGVNVMTNPLWFQNLAAASFLSPSGQCKPFDNSADGYCRGEGFAFVMMKRLSAAVADGDQILGTIRSTAVTQNQNCTPIFVPNAPSLSDLFRRVTSESGLVPAQIGYVEAHGTGTQVGDPAEYESIRAVLGGPGRSQPLALGSAKGLVGHTECTSGAVSMVKTVLAVQRKSIFPQRSFTAVNPHLHMQPEDKIEIVTKAKKWDNEFCAALINNYGASGSNASAVVTQAPLLATAPMPGLGTSTYEVPLRLCGKDLRSLKAFAGKLKQFIRQSGARAEEPAIADLAFNVCRQSNPFLEAAWIVSSRSTEQLLDKLTAFESGSIEAGQVVQPSARPVILCFGGQVSTFVGLDRAVYNNVAVLRNWLNKCDEVCRSIGCDSIFPGIFEKDPVLDPVKVQTRLFAMQYSSAQAWIECGVQPVAVVGHSFGELTSLCVSGVLSLRDAMSMIAGRAKVIRDFWGEEKGSMVAVESDLAVVQALLTEAGTLSRGTGVNGPTIACFNGPRSFTLAGSSKAIDITIETMSHNPKYSAIRFKKLSVTNAFHSTLVETLKQKLEEVGQQVTFGKPAWNLQRATESESTNNFTAQYIADHMRNPVYFSHAVQRLVSKYPSAVWLEAGSNSTITNMATRAAGSPKGHFFQPVNIANDNGLQFLTNATMGLWSEGLSAVTHWSHHRSQTPEYSPLLLPAYSFEMTRHWAELKVRQISSEEVNQPMLGEEAPKCLWTFDSYLDDKKRSAKFRVNTSTDMYKEFIAGHVIADTAPICPAPLQVQMAVDSITSLCPNIAETKRQPKICDVENLAPVCVDPAREVWLEVKANDESDHSWSYAIVSRNTGSQAAPTTHVAGTVVFISPEDAEQRNEFARYARLIRHQRCKELLQCDDADGVIQGRRHIYQAFNGVVAYSKPYQGLNKLVGRGTESAGRVLKKHGTKSWPDPHLADSFSQVGGVWVNCMTDKTTDDMYLATGFEKWMRSPDISSDSYRELEKWDVFGMHTAESDHIWLSDLYVFDAASGKLAEVILGIKYHKVAKTSMRKILTRLTVASELRNTAPVATVEDRSVVVKQPAASVETPSEAPPSKEAAPARSSGGSSEAEAVQAKIKDLLAEIAGLEGDAIRADTQLADIGIDSLMGMELARELEGLFKCTLPSDDLMTLTEFGQLVLLVQSTLGIRAIVIDDAESSTDSTEDSSDTPASANSDVTGYNTDNETSPDLVLHPSTVIEAFEASKLLTDKFITDYRCAGYMDEVLPRQTQMCIALTLDAFEELGVPLRTAKPGDRLKRIEPVPNQKLLANYLYEMLDKAARLINIQQLGHETVVTRTAMSVSPYKSTSNILANLLRDFPDHEWANRLTHFAAGRLADVLTGKQDGIKLIFGTEEGRHLVAGLYGDSLLNKLANVQMQDILTKLISKIPKGQGPIKILELGAGTGGTTKGMVPLLVSLGVPVEYTFTDLAGSFVAQARKTFKEYPFMRFRVHNIEAVPVDDLIGTQHVIIASNAIHATHNLATSTSNIRKMLRPDGFLMMLEMTQPLYWVDLIFGLFEGWWLFDDGRNHAIAHETVWQRELHRAGYGHVDWTDGYLPEIKMQRIIIATASGPQYDRRPLPPTASSSALQLSPTAAHQATIESYIAAHSSNFKGPAPLASSSFSSLPQTTVLLTGASGSLGTHLVAHLAALSNVASIICLNRRSPSDPEAKQQRAMEERRILPDAALQAKLQVLQTDTSKPLLGLSASEYERLVGTVTHIIHNAWPMSGKRPLAAMDNQFTVLRNLVDFANEIAIRHDASFKVGFQFISSIAVVGHYPLLPDGSRIVPENRMHLDAVLPNGYGEAKYICERILDETLHKFPEHFRTMSVRLGQVGGSRVSGYWNPMEHLSFLIKSSQTLRKLPAFEGDLCWTPLEDVAGTLADLVLRADTPHPIYHIDNPVRQPWSEMVPVLAEALNIPPEGVVPFEQWVRQVRAFPGAMDADNPAARLVEFLDDNFMRMSCGGLILDTKKSCEHSPTLSAVTPVSAAVARKYVQAWKDIGFLNES
ncbi:hypothetical protein S40285_08417 [Stachybotrys chlorohalonatus IBT 40285]|uniref:Uncharacterized protein n=1 Tax=Stachybotrys chlorohalonatus (strain IBT 40285) TaxID=1283841 RepID=A0A084Q8I6_STAC4|nr:hypothetical protein S40285_08417 [Stachybotrys chlorohalonata IBT 40285]